MKQLDLFTPPVRPSTVAWFPVERRHRFIANIARFLLEREGERRLKRWRLECSRLETDLFIVGIRDRAFIRQELIRFRTAVETEMRRQHAAAGNWTAIAQATTRPEGGDAA